MFYALLHSAPAHANLICPFSCNTCAVIVFLCGKHVDPLQQCKRYCIELHKNCYYTGSCTNCIS